MIKLIILLRKGPINYNKLRGLTKVNFFLFLFLGNTLLYVVVDKILNKKVLIKLRIKFVREYLMQVFSKLKVRRHKLTCFFLYNIKT